MALSKESTRGLAISLASLWIAAAVFAVVADQHYDGIFAADLPPGAPRNFLDFRSPDVLMQTAALSVLLALHWSALLWKIRSLRGFHAANCALALALALVIVAWFDKLSDDYYRKSLFCIGDSGERIWAIDVGWACEAAFYVRDSILPITTLLLLAISFVLRLTNPVSEQQALK